MRKIDVEAKPEIDLQRKINVEMSLQELLVLKAAVGEATPHEIECHLDKHHVGVGRKELITTASGVNVYDDLLELLENEGIEEVE